MTLTSERPAAELTIRQLTYAQALNEALAEEMERDPKVLLLGEDIGFYGGTFTVTKGLWERFGKERVIDTPISEAGFTGASLGLAMNGYRPVVEIMFIDFTLVAMDQIVNQIAKVRYMTGGQAGAPLVIRTHQGAGRGSAAQHSQSLEAWFAHIPGLKVAVPSNPADAKGLLKSAIRDPDPVIFIEHKLLYGVRGPVPDGERLLPLGHAHVVREGTDATVVAISRTVGMALEAAGQLAEEGVSVEVIDPRTVQPLDLETITHSVRKTGRLVIAHEATEFGGIGAEIAASVQRLAFDYLDAPIERVAAPFAPIPYAESLESLMLPTPERIADAVRSVR